MIAWCTAKFIFFTFKGKFNEAETEFIKAGKPKEAVLMWVSFHIIISFPSTYRSLYSGWWGGGGGGGVASL